MINSSAPSPFRSMAQPPLEYPTSGLAEGGYRGDDHEQRDQSRQQLLWVHVGNHGRAVMKNRHGPASMNDFPTPVKGPMPLWDEHIGAYARIEFTRRPSRLAGPSRRETS